MFALSKSAIISCVFSAVALIAMPILISGCESTGSNAPDLGHWDTRAFDGYLNLKSGNKLQLSRAWGSSGSETLVDVAEGESTSTIKWFTKSNVLLNAQMTLKDAGGHTFDFQLPADFKGTTKNMDFVVIPVEATNGGSSTSTADAGSSSDAAGPSKDETKVAPQTAVLHIKSEDVLAGSSFEYRAEDCTYGDYCVWDSTNAKWLFSNYCPGTQQVKYKIDNFKRKLNIQFYSIEGFKKAEASVAEFVGNWNYDATGVVYSYGNCFHK